MREEVIPILKIEDASRSVAWYGKLGFVNEWEHRFEPGFPVFVSLARGEIRLFVSEHEGDARPDTLVYLRVRDLDRIVREFGTEAEELPWGRELSLTDPDGNRLRISDSLEV